MTAVHFAGLSPASGLVRVLFFGRIADVCGRSVELAIPKRGCSLTELKNRIARQVEGGEAALREPCVRVAIDQVMASDDPWVSPGQEVAFLSAFSGG
ncbi:MoaD/ThiS family protein [Phenylobacterium sp. LH3H17]|uniref:MoaD/ThiS family protein n=1 Tax=Phenylobacterium sp. LH3H17 TaxID=2903901 RepID=UPI0020CA15E1|nr:MoaD/ThiS family protein [Phenylobacterium sp. LH3H17]UTP38456.1 MoaD/ThiS family protein [Phenylobacterium sp. LH3H17]